MSPDYWRAARLKHDLRYYGRGRFLQACNWLNIAVSLVILILLDVLGSFALLGGAFLVGVKSFLVYRLISRVIEMTVGFYDDVVGETEPRYTGLRAGQRISLAIHSYFDIIALYAAVYVTVFPCLLQFYPPSPAAAFLYSCSVSSFNFSLPKRNLLHSLVVFTQMFASLNLAVVSLASYITMKGAERGGGTLKARRHGAGHRGRA